jgi:hypothetical protein
LNSIEDLLQGLQINDPSRGLLLPFLEPYEEEGKERRRRLLQAHLPRIENGKLGKSRYGLLTPCWDWLGANSGEGGRGSGYPRTSAEGFTVAVHRWIWMIFYGPLPSKKHLDHCCRRRICINPTHLEPVTHLRNCRRREAARLLIEA